MESGWFYEWFLLKEISQGNEYTAIYTHIQAAVLDIIAAFATNFVEHPSHGVLFKKKYINITIWDAINLLDTILVGIRVDKCKDAIS